MSDIKKFDAFVKEEFGNYAPGVSPHIWENILAQREKRNPKGFWLNFFNYRNILILTGLLIIATGSVVYIQHNNTKANTYLQNNKENSSNNTVVGSTTAANSIGNSTSPEKVASTSVQTAGVNDDRTVSASTSAQEHAQQTTTKEQTGTTPVLSTNPKDEKNNSVTPQHKNTISSSAAGHNRSTLTGRIKTKFHSTVGETAETTENNVVVTDDQQKPVPGEIIGGTLLSKLLYGAENVSDHLQDKPNGVLPEIKEVKKIRLPGCPTIDKDTRSKQYIEVYAGPDLVFRSFSDTPNSTYLIKRKESTSLVNAYSAGVRYTKVYKNGLSIRTGFNYSQINEKFTFVQSNLTQVTYTTDPVTGDTTGTFIYKASSKKNTYNHYRSIDLPILIGYELDNGRWQMNFNAGAIINIYSWQKGELMGTDNRPVVITTGKGSSPYQYKSNFGLGLTASVTAYYQISDNLHVFFEPNYRYNLSPINKNNISLKQKYNSLGLRIGVRFDLK